MKKRVTLFKNKVWKLLGCSCFLWAPIMTGTRNCDVGTVTVINLWDLLSLLYFLICVAFSLRSFPTLLLNPYNTKGPHVLMFESPKWTDFLTLEPGLGEGALWGRVRVLLQGAEEVVKSLGPMQHEEPEKLLWEHLRHSQWEWEDQSFNLTPQSIA